MHVVGLKNWYNSFVCSVIDYDGNVSIKEFHSKLLMYENIISQ